MLLQSSHYYQPDYKKFTFTLIGLTIFMNKYKTYLHYFVAKIYKDQRRRQIAKIFTWKPLPPLEEGCTAIIGMCSRLPYLLAANLHCLSQCRWEGLKAVVITVDAEKSALPEHFADEIIAKFPELNISFYYYTPEQARYTVQAKDPYVYSWLSWCTCLNHVTTKHVLIHDYDALVLGGLEKRHEVFVRSEAKIQGIMWYKSEGLKETDHLATTFEAFADVNWIRSFPPVMSYNRVATYQGRRVNFDTFLEIQALHTPEPQRTIMAMTNTELSHPSQMITQYMRFRNTPAKPLACSAIIMIPFFHFLAGQTDAFEKAISALQQQQSDNIELVGDGVRFNLVHLSTKAVDFILKLILQVLVVQQVPPFKTLIDYGTELYKVTNTPKEQVWKGDFTDAQRQWIVQAINIVPSS